MENNILKEEKGFTLVELGIVIVIAALLVTSVVAAQNLIAAAKVRGVTKELEDHQTSFNLFVNKYRAFPGDMRNADEFFGTTNREGNGNAQIQYAGATGGDIAFEGNLAWEHMSNAGFADGAFFATNGNDVLYTQIPGSRSMGGAAGFAMNYDSTALGNHLIFGLSDGGVTTATLDGSVSTPEQASNIDLKLDDGLPNSGIMRAKPYESGTAADDCNNTGSDGYKLGNDDDILCLLWMKLD